MTDFFRAGTSRIGFSFDQSVSGGSSLDRFRPSFGFGKIVSPERQPVAVVEPFVGEDDEADRVRAENFFSCIDFISTHFAIPSFVAAALGGFLD